MELLIYIICLLIGVKVAIDSLKDSYSIILDDTNFNWKKFVWYILSFFIGFSIFVLGLTSLIFKNNSRTDEPKDINKEHPIVVYMVKENDSTYTLKFDEPYGRTEETIK